MNVKILASFIVLAGILGNSSQALAESLAGRQSMDDAWWTGPLLAPTAGTLPMGHFLIESYLYDYMPTASIDGQGNYHPVARSNNFGSQSYLLYGLAERFTVGLIPRFGFRDAGGDRRSSSVMLGDWTLQGQYQFTQFEEGSLIPTISLNVAETFPTGAYDHLDRIGNGFGAGAYATMVSLYTQTYFWMFNGRLLRTRFNLSYTLPTRASVADLSVYGTKPGFRGHASVGASAVGDLAFEYSITKNWVAAVDLWVEQDNNSRVSGRYPTGVGLPSNVINTDLGRSRIVYVAPAIEYNFCDSVGIIMGARISAIGENQTASVMPAIAFNYVH